MTLSHAEAIDQPRYLVRPLRVEELPLVLSTWLRAAWQARGLRWNRSHLIDRDDFFRGERARVEKLLALDGATAAVFPDVPDEVLGWACVAPAPGALHFVYTKTDYQGQGVARALLETAGLLPGELVVTSLTADVLGWIQRGRAVRYDPYLGG